MSDDQRSEQFGEEPTAAVHVRETAIECFDLLGLVQDPQGRRPERRRIVLGWKGRHRALAAKLGCGLQNFGGLGMESETSL